MGDPPLISRHAEDVLIGPAQGHRPRSAPVNRPGPYRNARNRTSEVAPILRAVPFSDQANRDKGVSVGARSHEQCVVWPRH